MYRSTVLNEQYFLFERPNQSAFSSLDYLLSIQLASNLTEKIDIIIETKSLNSSQISNFGQISIAALASPPIPKIATEKPNIFENNKILFKTQNNNHAFLPLFKKNNDSLIISNFKISNFELNSTTNITFQVKFLTENFLVNERIIIRFFSDIFPSNQGKKPKIIFNPSAIDLNYSQHLITASISQSDMVIRLLFICRQRLQNPDSWNPFLQLSNIRRYPNRISWFQIL